MKEIKVLKNSKNFEFLEDIEIIECFYKYLRDELKLSSNKAFKVIFYLQEELPVFPVHIEKCCHCKNIYDTWTEGMQDEKTDRFYCDNCRSD